MAKRKRDIIEPASEVPAVPIEALLTPDPEPIPAPPDSRYTVHSWNASPLYRCTVCAFDAFELQRVLDHYEKWHRPVAIDPPANMLDPDEINARKPLWPVTWRRAGRTSHSSRAG